VIGKYWDDLSDFPILGSREIWEFENPTSVMHPMHVHLVKFQILDKTDLATGDPIPLEPWELNTWKDIVRIPANAKARIIMDFTDYLGKFPQHCHILDHEDHEMMRQFQTINPPLASCGNGTCDQGEDCVSCSDDCAQTSGALCGNGLCEKGDGENCLTCPADCAGKQSGAASKQFCCGAPGGTNNIGCGINADDERCIDAAAGLFCRTTHRVPACCGDKLCEGAETAGSCFIDCDPVAGACTPTEPAGEFSCTDGRDNDCDGLIDISDPGCDDSDGDGLVNAFEMAIGTDPNLADTDGDGLTDYDEVNFNGNPGDYDPYHPVNNPAGTDLDANSSDSDGDGIDDLTEVSNTTGNEPIDPQGYPILRDGDCGPRGSPNGTLDAGDLVVAMRIALNLETASVLELAHCDMAMPNDGEIKAADILLLMQLLLSQ
jgi:hypothetical protein